LSNCGTRCGSRPKGSKKDPKMIMEDEGDFYMFTPEYDSHQDFTITPQLGETYRGVFYPEDKQSYVHVGRHENEEDIISTCVHESLHAAIYECVDWEMIEMLNAEIREKDTIKTNDRKEHYAIRIMLMVEDYFGE